MNLEPIEWTTERIVMFSVMGGIILIMAVLVIWMIVASEIRKRKNGGVDPVQEEQRQRFEEARERNHERRMEYRARLQEQKDDTVPVRTKVLYDTSTYTSKGSVGSAAGRAVVGSMIAGPVGAVVGAGTAKRTTQEQKQTTFKVWYKSGREAVETVVNGTEKWMKYMSLVDKE